MKYFLSNFGQFFRTVIIPRRNVQALFLTGDKAKESYAVISPHLDFKTKLRQKDKLTENLTHRKIRFDVEKLYEKWDLYRDIELRKDNLEMRRIDVVHELKQLTDNKNSDSNNQDYINKLKYDGKCLREDLKLLKENSYAIEDDFVQNFLMLPNDLHKRTPVDLDQIIYSDESNLNTSSPNTCTPHLDHEHSIEYYNETCYYLKGDAAIFDLQLPFHCVNYFKNNLNCIHFSNPDFIRTVVCEAAGLQSKDVLLLGEDNNPNAFNLLHLVGNGSMLSYLGYIAKLSIFPTLLPLRCITAGKQYVPQETNSHGLFSASQSTVVQSFIVTETQEACDQELDSLIKHIKDYYKNLKLPYKLSYIKADRLKPSESCRIHIDVYSKYLDQYITVGDICCYNDYISKHILFNIKDNKNYKFPFIISSTIVNVTKLLAVLIENSDTNNFVLPKFLK